MKQYKLPMPRDSEGELPPIRANSPSSSYLPLLLQHLKNAHFQSFFQPHNTEVASWHLTIFHALATVLTLKGPLSIFKFFILNSIHFLKELIERI